MSGNTKKNVEVRVAMAEAGLKQYELAELIGVNETVFSRWMRKDMDEDKKNRCLDAIRSYEDVNGN
jgi:ribosome-binding protein aMBF1 (putative translation factor)